VRWAGRSAARSTARGRSGAGWAPDADGRPGAPGGAPTTRTGGVEEIGRHPLDLVDRTGPGARPVVAQADIREAHRAGGAVVAVLAEVGVVDGDRELAERPPREADDLAAPSARGVTETGHDGRAAVEAQRDLGDPPVLGTVLHLPELHPVGGDRAIERRHDALVAHVREGADLPRGVQIAVEGPRRAVLGGVGDGVPVRRGPDALHALLDRHRPGVVARSGEHRQPGVGRVVDEGLPRRPARCSRRCRACPSTSRRSDGSCR